MSIGQQNKSIGCRLLATLAGCLLVSFCGVGFCSDIVELESVEGLRFETKSNNIVLTWPSARRESFVVLWRSNANWQLPWIVLTNQMRASSRTNKSSFLHLEGLSRTPTLKSHTNCGDYYRVFVIPDFWFELQGIRLCGGPKNPGEDFLPFYRGNKATDFFKPQISLVVDGKNENFGDEYVERVNFGSNEKPRWGYASGFWFRHDLLPNGEHTLQLTTLLTLNNFVGDLSQYLSLSNAPVKITVTNDITFLNWQSLIIGSNCTFVAQSTDPRVNWRIDVFDFAGQLLASKTGQALNGEIRWVWDLRDKQGKLHDTLETDPYFRPMLTTWSGEEKSDQVQRSSNNKDNGLQTWWSHFLGQDYERKPPSQEERRRRFIYLEPFPYESQVQLRPLSMDSHLPSLPK